MKLRTAIVEDQKPDAERLEQLLKKGIWRGRDPL